MTTPIQQQPQQIDLSVMLSLLQQQNEFLRQQVEETKRLTISQSAQQLEATRQLAEQIAKQNELQRQQMEQNKEIIDLSRLLSWARLQQSDTSTFLVPRAARNDDVKILQQMLSLGVDISKSCDDSGYSALHYAAGWGRLNAVNFLLENGSNIEAQSTDKEKNTPLSHAAKYNQLKIVALLLYKGASPDTPIIDLMLKDPKTDIGVKTLIEEYRKDPINALKNFFSHPENNPLHLVLPSKAMLDYALDIAIKEGSLPKVSEIIKMSVTWPMTVFGHAINSNKTEMLAFLLLYFKQGDLNWINKIVESSGSKEAKALLQEFGRDKNLTEFLKKHPNVKSIITNSPSASSSTKGPEFFSSSSSSSSAASAAAPLLDLDDDFVVVSSESERAAASSKKEKEQEKGVELKEMMPKPDNKL